MCVGRLGAKNSGLPLCPRGKFYAAFYSLKLLFRELQKGTKMNEGLLLSIRFFKRKRYSVFSHVSHIFEIFFVIKCPPTHLIFCMAKNIAEKFWYGETYLKNIS